MKLTKMLSFLRTKAALFTPIVDYFNPPQLCKEFLQAALCLVVELRLGPQSPGSCGFIHSFSWF